MSEQFKYAKIGICRVENFAEHLAAGIFPRIELGRLCGMNWYSDIRIDGDYNEVHPAIYCDNDDPNIKHSVRMYFNLLSISNQIRGLWKNDKIFKYTGKDVLLFDYIFYGFSMPILEILDRKNGWLHDGSLSFEYGIQVDAIFENHIWTFNFNDKLFNAGAEMVQFDRVEDPNTVGPLYAHKILLSFHSENYEAFLELKGTDQQLRGDFIDLLQICHGVRLNLHKKVSPETLIDALNLEMYTVISFHDWYFAQTVPWERLEDDKGLQKFCVFLAIKYNLRHFLASIMKSMTSLREFVGEEDVEKMSNESMKMFVAKFLYEKF